MSTVLKQQQAAEQRDHIIQTAIRLFGSYGIKTMTTDDIAAQCGISKKTLYRLFENKYDLLQVAVATVHVSISQAFNDLRASKDAMEEVLRSQDLTLKIFRRINYRMLLELEKYHYDIWRKVEAFRQEVIRNFIRANLRRGQEEGLYREDFDFELIAGMRLRQLIQLHRISGRASSQVPHELKQLTLHYLSGLATDRGRDRLTQSA